MRLARSHVAVFLLLLFALLRAPLAVAEEHWIEVRSPHFRVITNGSAGDGRRVADEFEDIRYVIHYRFPSMRLDAAAPLLIIAPKDEDTALKLEPSLRKDDGGKRVAGNFISGWARNCAMVRLDEWSRGAREVVYHEYTHSVFHLNSHSLPRWLDEGMAEFFAYTRFADHKIYIGAPTERSRFLASGHHLPIAELLAEQPRDYEKDEGKTQHFYAESWALVHYLTFGPNMDGGVKLAAFFDDLQNGKEQLPAFAAHFGPPEALDEPFRQYLSRFGFTAGILPAPPTLETATYAERPLPPAEVDYELGTFHTSEGDTKGGRELIEAALALDGKLAGAHEEMGYLFYGEGKDDEARAQWREAAALDPTLYRARFAYLMTGLPFAQQTPEQLQASLTELRAVAHQNRSFAPAYVEVALLQWRRGDLSAAWPAAHEATSLEPWRAGYRMLEGHVLLAEGKGAQAAKIARAAAQFAEGTDRAEAVALWLEVPPAERGEGPPLSYNLPSGAVVTHGVVSALQCSERATGERFSIDLTPEGPPTGAPLHLTRGEHLSLGTADSLYRGERRMSLCRHAAGRNALVAYTPTQAGAGDLLWMQVMDDLPAIPMTGRQPASTEAAPSRPVPGGAPGVPPADDLSPGSHASSGTAPGAPSTPPIAPALPAGTAPAPTPPVGEVPAR